MTSQPERDWTVKAALEWTQGYLERKGDANPLLSARGLLSHATGLTHLELYTLFDRPLSLGERDVLRDAVARRGKGEPLQYITGRAPFRYLEVRVRPGVLIPRPETEVLVDEVINALDQAHVADPRIADICTGSGCIACALATEVAGAEVWATDLSEEACAIARENIAALGVQDRVHLIECDLDAGIPDELAGTFHALVSNPPYVPAAVYEQLPAEVHEFEPRMALESGADGLDAFRRLMRSAHRLLGPQGAFVVELHEDALGEARSLAEQDGFKDVRVVPDLAGRPRILVARV